MLSFSSIISTFALIFALIYLKGDAAPITDGKGIVRCPYNESEWKERSASFPCQGDDVYHCFIAENSQSVREKCIERTMILKGFCPVFSDAGYLHWAACNHTDCPNITYVSDAVYKYRVCFGETDSITFSDGGNEESSGMALGLGLGLIGIFLVIVVSVLIYIKRSRQTKEFEDIANGTTVLRSESIIYVVGNLGNSVSTVGKGIVETYARKHNMEHIYVNYLDIPEITNLSENTVYFVDGWYGLWNDNPCEKQSVIHCLRLIMEAGNDQERNTKFVIGLRTDIRDSYREDFNDIGRFSQRPTILRESSSKEKRVKLKTHLKNVKRVCTATECQCKSLKFDKLMSMNTVPIGKHLIVKLMDLDHTKALDLVHKDKGPLIAMRDHFTDLKSADEHLFKCILYIVLIGFYDRTEFRHDVGTHFSISETNLRECDDLEKYTKTLNASQLAPMWASQLTGEHEEREGVRVFWHNFLYICAFHACFALYPDQMMQHCNLDAILQLVRPEGQRSPFTVEADEHLITSFYQERIKGKVIEDHVKDHPLLVFLGSEV